MKTVFNLYAQALLAMTQCPSQAAVNELFVIYNACSNRGGNSRISRNVAGFYLLQCEVLIVRGMSTLATTQERYANCVNQQIPAERDGFSI